MFNHPNLDFIYPTEQYSEHLQLPKDHKTIRKKNTLFTFGLMYTRSLIAHFTCDAEIFPGSKIQALKYFKVKKHAQTDNKQIQCCTPRKVICARVYCILYVL
jgi:hypothetical protein